MYKTTPAARRAATYVAALVLAISGAFAANPSAQEHLIEITGFAFVPDAIEVNPGDTITWVNRDLVPHTASSADGSWDTGTLKQNESKSLIVTPTLSSAYLCRFHLNMTGSIALINRDVSETP